MLGRDFEALGTNGNILRSFGDNEDDPFAGPVKVKFIDKHRLAVIDKDRGLHIQHLNGSIEAYIMPQKVAQAAAEEARRKQEMLKKGDLTESKDESSVEEDDELSITRPEDVNDNDATDGEPTNYIDLSFADLCTIPMSKDLAVCDKITNTIKQVNREDWNIERHLGKPKQNFEKPQFKRLCGISCFQLGFKIYYVTCERFNRIQILSEGGNTLHVMEKSGLLPGEFDEPTAVASYVDPSFQQVAKGDTPIPHWYMGKGTKQDLETCFSGLSNKQPGDFVVYQRQSNESCFDVKLLGRDGNESNILISKAPPTNGSLPMVQLSIAESNKHMMPWPSVWEVVQNYAPFMKSPDPRPFVLLAILDFGNKRVQVFKYFWMVSELFRSSIEPFFIIGGRENESNCRLVQPQCIAFTPTGEVAVCDDFTKEISIISTVSKSVIRVIRLSFINHIENIDNPSIYHDFALARNRDQRQRDAQAQDEAYKDYLKKFYFDRNPKKRKLTKRQFLGSERTVTQDPFCCSIDFSPDGKLAIGYRMGGILVLKPFKMAKLGSLTNLEHSCFNLILDYCEYSDYEALRECCTYLHNYTSRRRQLWELKPLGGIRRKNVAFVQFLQWAKLPQRSIERIILQGNHANVHPEDSSMLKWVSLLDEDKRVCCLKKWLSPETNIHKGTKTITIAKKPKTQNDHLPVYLRKKEVVEYCDKTMAVFSDVSEDVLRSSDEADITCSDPTCCLSHRSPVLDTHHLMKLRGFMDKSCLLLAISKLCGDVFLYRNEAYISHLFDAFAEECEVVVHKESASKVDVLRKAIKVTDRCLDLKMFMEVMLMCEEDFQGAKPMRKQFLFHRCRASHQFIPKVVVEGPAMAVQEHGNLIDVIQSQDDLGSLLYANDIVQYRDGLKVPHKKNTNKSYRKVNGAEEEERGLNEPHKLQYNKAFIIKADRAEAMIDKMFA